MHSHSLKYGTDFNTWLLANNALGLVMAPEESLREYKMIFVSTNRPEEIESFRASRNGRVQSLAIGIGIGGGMHKLLIAAHLYMLGAAIFLAWIVWLGKFSDQWGAEEK